MFYNFFFQAEDGIRDYKVTGVQTCALPICFRLRLRCRWREEGHLSRERKERKQRDAECNRQHSHDRPPLMATRVRRCGSFRTDYRLRTAERSPDPGVAHKTMRTYRHSWRPKRLNHNLWPQVCSLLSGW